MAVTVGPACCLVKVLGLPPGREVAAVPVRSVGIIRKSVFGSYGRCRSGHDNGTSLGSGYVWSDSTGSQHLIESGPLRNRGGQIPCYFDANPVSCVFTPIGLIKRFLSIGTLGAL